MKERSFAEADTNMPQLRGIYDSGLPQCGSTSFLIPKMTYHPVKRFDHMLY